MIKTSTLFKGVFSFILLISSYISYSQPCLPLNVSNSGSTSASCPSSGGITITATGTSLTYQIISGPSGFPPASNSTGIFNGLAAGNYTIQVKDACNVTSNVSVTVTNSYQTFSASSGSASNVCTSGTQGGTVTGNVVGGKSPYQYDIVLVGSSPVYGANTTAVSYVENVTTFGTYRFFAKDACGEVRTYDVEVLPLQPLPVNLQYADLLLDRPCNEKIDGLSTLTLRLRLLDSNGSSIYFNNLVGSTWQVYKPAVANSINISSPNCTTAMGSLLNSGSILNANIDPSDAGGYKITIPKEDVIFTMTTQCGQTFKYCLSIEDAGDLTPRVNYAFIQAECNAVWNNQKISIEAKEALNMSGVTYTLTKNGGGTVINTTGKFYNLTPLDLPATVSATDTCGRNFVKNFSKPVQGSALIGTAAPFWALNCTTIKNAVTAEIVITGGDLPGIEKATNVTITGGTPTAVPSISNFFNWIPGYLASNLLPGYTYKIMITNLCNEKDSVIFTVPTDHWGMDVLDWNLTANVNSLCGQNKGTINANANYSGSRTVNYYLYNKIAPLTVIATNTSGVFNNVTPGNYKVKFIIPSESSACLGADVMDSVDVSVLPDGGSQTITRKVVVNCESGGSVLPTGKATVEVNGSAPFTYEIIKTSLIGTGGEVWNLSSTGNPNNTYTWNLPLAGDPSGTVYTFRSTDKCGNKVTTQGAMQPLGTPVVETAVNPCVNQLNYSISVTPYPDNFSYRWVKLPDLVTTLSTDNSLLFPGPYAATNDGTYRCYVSLPGCVDRAVDVTINSANCGAFLPVTLTDFTGLINNGNVTLTWNVENEINMGGYEIERSADGVNFKKVYYRPASLLTEYNFADNNITLPVVYYRLKMIEKNGKYTYSHVIKLSVSNTPVGIEVYPNPAKSNISISIHSHSITAGKLRIVTYEGTEVYRKKIQVTKGVNNFNLPDINRLPPGSYIIIADYANQVQRAKFVKL